MIKTVKLPRLMNKPFFIFVYCFLIPKSSTQNLEGPESIKQSVPITSEYVGGSPSIGIFPNSSSGWDMFDQKVTADNVIVVWWALSSLQYTGR